MTFRFSLARPFVVAVPALFVVGVSLLGALPARGQREQAAALKTSLNPPGVKDIMTRIGKGAGALGPAIGQGLKADAPNWQMLQPQAKQYNELAAALGRNEPPRGSQESWTELTAAFAASASDLEKAIRARDKPSALVANDQLANSCMACHRAHRGGPGMGMPPGAPGGPPGNQPPGPNGAPKTAANDADAPAETPDDAVRAFLAALGKKDAKALAKTVSRRAPAELVIRAHKKTLESILSRKIAAADLARLSTDFAGSEVETSPAIGAADKATVMITQGDARRKVYVRRDGDAWKVVDFGGKVGGDSRARAKAARSR